MEGAKLEPELIDASHNKDFGNVTGKCKHKRHEAQAKEAEALGGH